MVENLATIEEEIRRLANKYSENLAVRIDARMAEMESDDRSHYLRGCLRSVKIISL